jgi:hypothetical protein
MQARAVISQATTVALATINSKDDSNDRSQQQERKQQQE